LKFDLKSTINKLKKEKESALENEERLIQEHNDEKFEIEQSYRARIYE